MTGNNRKISFPADSVLSAIIQDGDTQELWNILNCRRGSYNLNQQNHVGLTALHHAVLCNNLDAVKMLLVGGSDVNAKDMYGFSPLHTAAACGFLPISSLLILFGADLFAVTKQSDFPVDLANDLAMSQLLASEMCQQLHSELYMQSFVMFKLRQLWTSLVTWIRYLYRVLTLKSVNTESDEYATCSNNTLNSSKRPEKVNSKRTEKVSKLD